MKVKSIAIFGCLPPPMGGMSMHVKRLSALLKSHEIQYAIYSDLVGKVFIFRLISTVRNLFIFTINKNHEINYVISASPFKRFLYVLMGRLFHKKVIIRLGGFGFQRNIKKGGIYRFVEVYAIRNSYKILVVSKEIYEQLILLTDVKNIEIIPGFIPPYYEIKNPNSKNLEDFYSESKYKILTTGQLLSNNFNKDVYGIIPLTKFVKYLVDQKISVKLVIILYGTINNLLMEQLEESIKTNELDNTILTVLQTDGSEIIPLLKRSNIFIRNSFEEGDSNVLREALYFNNKCYASDCVKRPEDCFTYKTGDIDDLMRVFSETSENRDKNLNFELESKINETILIKFLIE